MGLRSQRSVALLAGVCLLLIASAHNATAYHSNTYQVGVQGQGLINNIGFRSNIETVIPQSYGDDAAGYFWIGEYLSSGEFLQVGWGVHAAGCGAGEAFVFAAHFDTLFQPISFRTYPCGSAGLSGSFHVYDFQRTASNPDGTYLWVPSVDGVPLVGAPFVTTGANSGNNSPYAMAELSRSGLSPPGLPDTSDDMGPTRFGPAIAARFNPQQPQFSNAPVGLAVRDAPCPPYGIRALSVNNVIIGDGFGAGTGYSCASTNTLLWDAAIGFYWQGIVA